MSEIKFDELIGKLILIGVTYTDARDHVLARKQWWGWVQQTSAQEGIRVQRGDTAAEFVMPPDLLAVSRATPGEYRVKETGEVITDPDFLATWNCVDPEGRNQTEG